MSYKAKVINLISDNIKYPYIAKKRGYEGKFIFELIIDKKGKLIDYKIIEKNGKSVLEKSAIKTITSIKYPNHKSNIVKIKVPIVFKIIN
jgi:protein TonB